MLAARLHDEGKRAERWQRAFSAPRDGNIYAKTKGPLRRNFLDCYRHEFGSLPYVEKSKEFHDLTDELKDLVLHLVAAHHGRARPTIETAGSDDAPPSALAGRAREVALRFARLQKDWGPWGLAWLEALVRAADQQASRENDKRGRRDGGASIPVDLFNPGQVFACLGFLEAAEILLGDAEGGFDWSDEANVRFRLRAAGEEDPVSAVLEFLAAAEVRSLGSTRIADALEERERCARRRHCEDTLRQTVNWRSSCRHPFLDQAADRMALPSALVGEGRQSFDSTIGATSPAATTSNSRRVTSADRIARAMLRGVRRSPQE